MKPVNNPSRTPSYLFQSRHGIYYFRVRIPLSIKKRYNISKTEFRRSLETRSHSVALRLSKRLWVKMEDSDYAMKDIEREMESFAQEEALGKKLLKRFLIAQIESKETGILDNEDADSFFSNCNENEKATDIILRELEKYELDLLTKHLDGWEQLPYDLKRNILLNLKKDNDNNLSLVKHQQHEPIINTDTIYINNSINQISKLHIEEKLLVDAINDFLQNYIEINSRGNAKPPSKATLVSYEGILKEFIRIVGGDKINCHDITKETIKFYDTNIWRTPKSFMKMKIYDGLDINSVIKLGEKLGSPTKKNETVKNHTMRVREFIKWAEGEVYIISGLDKYLIKVPGSNERANEKVDPFSDEDLHKLFNNEIYESGKFKNKPSRYWLPLIALFTGMRGEEIAQLLKNDVIKDKDTDIWYFNLVANYEINKNLKNKNSRRKIPIHPQLNRLGFIEYIDKIKSDCMIFPELFNKNGDHYKNFGNCFNRKNDSGWKWKCGVKGNTKFHSFRHTFTNTLKINNVADGIIAGLLGHGHISNVVPNYNKPDSLKICYAAINKLSYPSIDWSKIEKRRW